MKINNENSCRILNFRIRQLQPKHISFILFSAKKHGTEICNRMRPIMIADSRLLRQLAYEQAIPFDGVVQMIRKSAGCLRPCTFSASAASFIGKNLVGFDKSAKRMVQLLCHLLKLTQSPHHGCKVKRIFQFKLTAEKQHMRIFFTSFPPEPLPLPRNPCPALPVLFFLSFPSQRSPALPSPEIHLEADN